LVALLNGYLWNRNWTFHHHGVVWKQGGIQQFSLFATAAVGGLAFNVTAATLVVNWASLPAGWDPIQLANVGALLALVGTATWDFLCYNFVVFRPVKEKRKSSP
jgi:putative flippase GtrA